MFASSFRIGLLAGRCLSVVVCAALALAGSAVAADDPVQVTIDLVRRDDVEGRAIGLDQNFALAHAGLGCALWLKYDASHYAALVPLARAACAQALTHDAVSPAAHVCLGTVALGTGAFNQAAGAFQLALDREPTNDEAYVGLARAQARSGATSDAETTYKRAIALRPQYWATHVRLGTFYREHARYAEAVQQYELALTLTPDISNAEGLSTGNRVGKRALFAGQPGAVVGRRQVVFQSVSVHRPPTPTPA